MYQQLTNHHPIFCNCTNFAGLNKVKVQVMSKGPVKIERILKSVRFYFLLLIAFLSCQRGERKAQPQDNLLISSISTFVMEDGENVDGYFKNRNRFIKPYTSVEYINGAIKATTLHLINSCGEFKGNVKVSNDTLYLLVENIGNEKCASVQLNKITYVIRNPLNKKYIINF